MPRPDAMRRFLPLALLILLLASWLAGGVTTDATAADEWLQLLALPVLILAVWQICQAGPVTTRLQRAALAMAVLVFAVPALQMLPIPSAAWQASEPRQALAADLALAGVQDPQWRWSLVPAATEAALWALLPALAAFLAALALPSGERRRLVKLVLLLVAGNVLFAFFQTGLPPDSALRLYHGRDAGFGGLLANTNHQATALIIGMVLATGQAVHAWRRARADRGPAQAWPWYAGFAAGCFLLVPLSTSRAGMALALPALVAILLLGGAVSLRRGGGSVRRLGLLLGLALLAAIGLNAAMGWMAVDQAEEIRHAMTRASAGMATEHAPWGSGAGSFVRVFEQGAPAQFWFDAYVNHAHNEFVQWWLEAGWLGLLASIAGIALLFAAGWQVAAARGRDGNAILAASCFVAVCAVLAHSWADFPLRTTALMTTTASLAGLMLAALADVRGRPAARDLAPASANHDPQPA